MSLSPFRCTLATPHKCLFDGEAWQVTVPGRSGRFALRSGHAPILAVLAGGTVEIAVTETQRKSYRIGGGMLELTGNSCAVTAESADS